MYVAQPIIHRIKFCTILLSIKNFTIYVQALLNHREMACAYFNQIIKIYQPILDGWIRFQDDDTT
jgi:hypothetical protein